MVGTSLSHYNIIDELGRGGMGIVYKAEDTKLNRTVALKVLPPAALANEDDRARFFREAQAAAQLHHPHIATVFAIEEATGDDGETRPFIAMEFIDGVTLGEKISEGPMKLDDVIRIALEVAEALKAAHAKDIVHRDIKSGNIMLSSDGTAKVLDFGLAKTAHSTMLTQMGSTLGTVAYMSPEQAKGEEVDARSDVYSLGTVIYEMIAGRLPYAADYEQAIIYSILNEEAEPLTAVRTGVSMGMEQLVSKCLEKDRDLRHQSASSVIADLKTLKRDSVRQSRTTVAPGALSSSQIGGAERPGLGEQLPRSSELIPSRRRQLFAFVGLFVIVALIYLSFLAGRASAPQEIRSQLFELKLPGGSGVVESTTSADGKYIAYTRGAGLATDVLELYSMIDGSITRLNSGDIAWSPRFSPSGQWLTYSAISTSYKVRLPGGTPIPFGHGLEYFSWDGDTHVLISALGAARMGVERMDIDGRSRELIALPDSARGHRSISRAERIGDSSMILATTIHDDELRTRDLVLVDEVTGSYEVILPNAGPARYLESGHLLYEEGIEANRTTVVRPFDWKSADYFTGPAIPLDFGDGDTQQFAVGLDGSLLYSSIRHGETNAYRVNNDWSLGESLPFGDSDLGHPSISPDGKKMVVQVDAPGGANTSEEIRIYNLDDGAPLSLTVEGNAHPAFSPDGDYVYYSGVRDGADVLMRAKSDGSAYDEVIPVPHARAREPSLSPDGQWLVYMGVDENPWYEIFALNLETNEVVDVVRSEVGLIDPVFSPDGKYVAFEADSRAGSSTIGQELRVVEFGGDGEWIVSDDSDNRAWDPAWGPNGEYIYWRGVSSLYRRRVQLDPTFLPQGQVEKLMEYGQMFNFAVSPTDGSVLILAAEGVEDPTQPDLTIVTNWVSTLNEFAPRDR